MSYILDALKRAEAERDRGAVPGLHAQPHPVAAPEPRAAAGPWLWGMGAALVVAAVLGAWWLGRDTAPPAAAVVVPAQAAALPSAPPAAAPSAPAPAVVASAAAARPVAVLPPIPAAAPVPAAVAVAPPPVASAPAPRPVAAATPAEAPVPAQKDLPDAIRQQLPTLAISGATYSENPQYRMVIVNGQVLHEGDTAAPGVVLEKIRQKEVVLRTQGYRYAAPY